MQTRHAEAADVKTMVPMARAAFVDAYGQYSAPDDIEKHLEKHFSEPAIAGEMRKSGVAYFLAEIDGCCAGLVKLRDSEVPECLGVKTAVELQQLYVATDWQRRGVGKALMDCAIAEARRRNVDGLWLSVWKDAAWATAFYRRCGFQERGTTQFMLGSTEYLDLILWRPTER